MNCWCPSRSASDWADWMKPRARSVYFSRFISDLLDRRTGPEAVARRIKIGLAPCGSRYVRCRCAAVQVKGCGGG